MSKCSETKPTLIILCGAPGSHNKNFIIDPSYKPKKKKDLRKIASIFNFRAKQLGFTK